MTDPDRVHVVTLTPGETVLEWCERCRRHHAATNIYTLNHPDAPPITRHVESCDQEET